MFVKGQECHYGIGSDVHPVVIEKVSAAKIVAREMVSDREKGGWKYDPERGEQVSFSRRGNGKFMLSGRNFGVLHEGFDYYYDPHF